MEACTFSNLLMQKGSCKKLQMSGEELQTVTHMLRENVRLVCKICVSWNQDLGHNQSCINPLNINFLENSFPLFQFHFQDFS